MTTRHYLCTCEESDRLSFLLINSQMKSLLQIRIASDASDEKIDLKLLHTE